MNGKEKVQPRNSYLTGRQLQIMKLRQGGSTTEQIAKEIGTTRQNVIILEKRAHRNLDRAIRTLNVVREMMISINFDLKEGTHMLDAVREIVSRADRSGIRLNDNLIGIMTKFKVAMDNDLRGGKTQRPITVMMFHDGRVQFI